MTTRSSGAGAESKADSKSYRSKKIFFSPIPGVIKPIHITHLEKNESSMYLNTALVPKRKLIEDQKTMGVNNALMVGLPGSGKTTIANIVMGMARKEYPQDLNIVYSDSLAYNLDHIEDCFFNLLIVDDAVEMQDSKSGMSNEAKKLTADFFSIRHLFDERFNRKIGYVVTMFGTQMYKALNNRLRQAPITIFTSTFNDKPENRFIEQTITPNAYSWLKRKTGFLYLHNRYDVNAFCIIKFNDLVKAAHFIRPETIIEKFKTEKMREDVELEYLRRLLAKKKMSKHEIYKIFAYANSKDRPPKQITDREVVYYAKLSGGGLSNNQIADLFGHSTTTIGKYLGVYYQRMDGGQSGDKL